MFNEKEKRDLDLLIQTGVKQAQRLSSMTVSNYFVGFPSEKQTEDTYREMIAYLESAGIEIIDDGSGIEAEDDFSPLPEIRPFDPGKIDIDMRLWNCPVLLNAWSMMK